MPADPQHIQIDAGKPTAIGVHYDSAVWAATRHFQDAGFHGIEGMRVMEHGLDCNEARRRALDAAKRGEGKCYWQGAWDYSAGRCSLFQFEFTSYDGPTFTGEGPDAEAHVDHVEG